MKPIELWQGDCLKLMKNIPDGSVDLVLTDPPYNIGKAKWDKIDNYIEWCEKWIKQCERVLKRNGTLYIWHSDMFQLSQIMEVVRTKTNFVFNSFNIWEKNNFRTLVWKRPSEKSNLRSWFNVCEFCVCYTFVDEIGTEIAKARKLQGMTINKVAEMGGFYGKVNHGGSVSNWENGLSIPSKKQYEKLQTFLPLKRKYEDLIYTHNLDNNHTNIWKSEEKPNGKIHICKKPKDILTRIIKTSSKENATVLDCFMGSGSTGVACVNTGRRFVGIELDEGYFETAARRIEEARERRTADG